MYGEKLMEMKVRMDIPDRVHFHLHDLCNGIIIQAGKDYVKGKVFLAQHPEYLNPKKRNAYAKAVIRDMEESIELFSGSYMDWLEMMLTDVDPEVILKGYDMQVEAELAKLGLA